MAAPEKDILTALESWCMDNNPWFHDAHIEPSTFPSLELMEFADKMMQDILWGPAEEEIED